MLSASERFDRTWKIWFPPINLWSRPYQTRFDETKIPGEHMSMLEKDLNAAVNLLNEWVSTQNTPEMELLCSIYDNDDTIWFLPVARHDKAGLFIVFEPVTDRLFLSRLSEQNYSVVACRRFEGAKNALTRYLA